MPPALLKPGFHTIVTIVLAYMLSTNGYRLYFSANYLDIELLYDKVYWVVLYRSRWCYIDHGGVISITVVLYRSVDIDINADRGDRDDLMETRL